VPSTVTEMYRSLIRAAEQAEIQLAEQQHDDVADMATMPAKNVEFVILLINRAYDAGYRAGLMDKDLAGGFHWEANIA